MAQAPIDPKQWRNSRRLSQAKVAMSLGYGGKNPARVWHRWETGEGEPPVSVIVRIEIMSDGQVTAASWLAVRQAYLSRLKEKAAP